MSPKATEDLPRSGVLTMFLLNTRSITFLLCILSLSVLVSTATGEESLEKSQPRYKRNVLQLCELVRLYTGRLCSRYNRYGCYCGLRTSSATPVDAVDSCCRAHDICYGNLGGQCTFFPSIFNSYNKECNGNVCTCTDSPTRNQCEYNTCQCDLTFVQCLQNATYNRSYYRYKKSRCVN